MPPSDSPQGAPLQGLSAAGSEFNAQAHLFASLLASVATATLVQVKAVQSGGVAGPSFVDVQPMVGQVDGDGNVTPHGVIHNIPAFRLQSGGNAVVLDPAIGDIGICVFASRDISAIKTTRAPSQPGSARRFDMADGLYIGGFLNGPATQYVLFDASGIKLVSPTAVNIQAPTVAITGTTLTHNGVNIGATHVHGGVTAGGANTAIPH